MIDTNHGRPLPLHRPQPSARTQHSTAQRPSAASSDSREVWDEDDATEALGEAIRIVVDGITVEGTQMADEREALLWSIVNCFHAQIGRLDRAVDRIVPEMKDLETAQDGTEVKAWELQLLTDRARNLGDRRDAFERLRDTAADAYRAETGEYLASPQRIAYLEVGKRSRPPPSTRATSGAHARSERPAATCRTAPWWRSPAARRLLTPPSSGASSTARTRSTATWSSSTAAPPASRTVAAKWAEARSVDQVIVRPDWKAHGRAAPFRRNDALLDLLPKGVIAFAGSGVTGNLVAQGPPDGHPGSQRIRRRITFRYRGRSFARRGTGPPFAPCPPSPPVALRSAAASLPARRMCGFAERSPAPPASQRVPDVQRRLAVLRTTHRRPPARRPASLP